MPAIERFLSPVRLVLLIVGTSLAGVLLLDHYLHKAIEQPKQSDFNPAAKWLTTPRLGFWPGLRLPPTRSAAEAGLAEDAEVIGVCVRGRARAYGIAALSGGPEFHVVNDLLGGRAVTVAYCDIRSCARVFTATSSDAPLDVGFGGLNERMVPILQVDNVDYALEDGKNLSHPQGPPLPYPRLEHERTTWGEWRRAHPDTDVYVSSPPPSKGAVRE
jgi:hypothetical protein